MSNQELEAMGETVQAEEPQGEEQAAEAAPEVEQPAPAVDMEQLAGMVGVLIQGVGNIVCDRAGVSELREEETTPVGRAVVQFLMLFDLNVNPKVAAGCALVVAAAPPVLIRIEERREAKKAREAHKPEPGPEPEPKKTEIYGEGQNVTPPAVKPESKPRRGRAKKTR